MARPLWNGSISFGLVQIPVGLVTAENSAEELSFTLLDAKDHAPVGYRHVNKVTGEEVPKERRVKGYEVKKGEYVILDDDDFKRANVKATETIDIVGFVDEVPVMRWERPYYIAPQKRGTKAYALLRDALVKTGKVGIATFVLRNRQHLCAVVPEGDVLVLELLRFDEEVAGAPEIEGGHPRLAAAEIEMATKLVEGMSTTFDELKVKDTYHDDLMEIIHERAKHPEKVPEPHNVVEKPSGEVVDIMALLKKSVEGHKHHKRRA
jgi:DNA end-binding protein Ku